MARFEAALLNIGSDDWRDDNPQIMRENERSFVGRYSGAHRALSRSGPILGGNREDASGVFQQLCALQNLCTESDVWTPLDAKLIAARLDLHAPTPTGCP